MIHLKSFLFILGYNTKHLRCITCQNVFLCTAKESNLGTPIVEYYCHTSVPLHLRTLCIAQESIPRTPNSALEYYRHHWRLVKGVLLAAAPPLVSQEPGLAECSCCHGCYCPSTTRIDFNLEQ